MKRLNDISFIEDFLERVYPLAGNFTLASPSPYEVNAKHGNLWLKLLREGNVKKAKKLSRKWVGDFSKVIYNHNTYLQGLIKGAYGDFYLVDDKVVAKVLIVFKGV